MAEITTLLKLLNPLPDELDWDTPLRTTIQKIDAGYPFYNVKAYGGAVGDGSNDDTAEIQGTLDDAGANSIVYFPPGRYKVSSTLLCRYDGMTVFSAGSGGAVGGNGNGARLEAATGLTGAVMRVQRDADDRPLGELTFLNLSIDGGNLGSGVDGLHFRAYQSFIQNVKIWRCTGDGLWIQGYAGWATYDTRVNGLLASGCGGAGIYASSRGEDLHFTNCILFTNQDGMRIQAASEQITACHTYDNTRFGMYFDGGGTRSKVEACKIEGNDGGGMRMDSTNGGISDIIVLGNNFADNFTTNNTQDELAIGGNAGVGITGCQIVGNNFTNKGGGGAGTKSRYAINLIDGSAQATLVAANRFGRVSTGSHFAGANPVNNAGSTSQWLKANVYGNVGQVDMAGGQRNWGSATITSGQTTSVVTHGLDFTPNARDITITQTTTATNQGPFWVTAIGATTFTVNHIDPGASGVSFDWKAVT